MFAWPTSTTIFGNINFDDINDVISFFKGCSSLSLPPIMYFQRKKNDQGTVEMMMIMMMMMCKIIQQWLLRGINSNYYSIYIYISSGRIFGVEVISAL
jgi:hypothetical protein